MDCCNYGEYRGGAYGAGGWEGYAPHAPPYAYAHAYYAPHAHDPYARYYRYDYPAPHIHHSDHVMPMDYGAYASKEARVRRTLARREQRAHTPAPHLPLPHTPPLECGINGRGPPYCDPQMWPHYQMGVLGGGGGSWSGANAVAGSWASRGACAREHLRYPTDCRPIKGPHMHTQSQVCPQGGRSTPYPVYEDTTFNGESVTRRGNTAEYPAPNVPSTEAPRPARDRFYAESRQTPPEPKPPVVPLPAFQQAFGSTEIGKFAEAFSRTEVVPLEDPSSDNFVFETFPEWDASTDPQWSAQPATREIKCEDTY